MGFKYHGFDADLNKTLKGRHYYIADKRAVKNALKKIRDSYKITTVKNA